MRKEEICIDLSKCTQEERKNIYKTIEDAGEKMGEAVNLNEEGNYSKKYNYLVVDCDKEWIEWIDECGRAELSYTEFINFFKPKQTNPFKVGDKVYSAEYGWGEVESVSYVECTVKFNDTTRFVRTQYLSFTEYTMQGFSQERPIDYEQMAKDKVVGWFWDEGGNGRSVMLGRLIKYSPKAGYEFMNDFDSWKNFRPLTPEEKEVLEKNELFNEIFKK